MGVKGLWQLLQPTGHPVTLESLEGKVLAVDVSIWLNQTIKGMRDKDGNPLPNAHLLGLFHRVCKLLFYRIKPIFVFDGGVPALKRQTLKARRQRKEFAADKSDRAAKDMLENLLKHHAVSAVLGTAGGSKMSAVPSSSQQQKPDMFELPPLPVTADRPTDVDVDLSWEARMDHRSIIHAEFQNLEDIDLESADFKNLPPEIQHEILVDLKESSYMNSWAKMHEMPKESGDFSNFQLARLRQRSHLSQKLADVRKEINIQNSGEIAHVIAGAQAAEVIESSKLASEDTAHYILVKGLSRAKQEEQVTQETGTATLGGAFRQDSHILQMTRQGRDIVEVIKAEREAAGKQGTTTKQTQADSESESQAMQGTKVTETQDKASCRMAKDGEPAASTLREHSLVTAVADSRSDRDTHEVQIVSSDSDTDEIKQTDSRAVSVAEFSLVRDTHDIQIVSSDSDTETSMIAPINPRASSNIPGGLVLTDSDSVQTSREQVTPPSQVVDSGTNSESVDKETGEMVLTETADFSADGGFIHEDEEADSLQTNKIDSIDSNKTTVENPVCDVTTIQNGLTHKAVHSSSISEQRPTEKVVMTEKLERPVKQLGEMTIQEKSEEKTQESSSDDENDFIEVRVIPGAQPDDDLFPASIFLEGVVNTNQSQELVTERSAAEVKTVAYTTPHEDVIQPDDLQVIEESNEFQGLSREELVELQSALMMENSHLSMERGRQQRMANSVTEQMTIEAQDLLQLFGVPYIISPMEAEAQCAYLDLTNQTEGSITDDSDIWLFGGRRVYKNFFNQSRHVEFFKAEDITRQFLLDREKLISLALVCGSDYTEGIDGLGPVAAMEILGEFSGEGMTALNNFRAWWDEAQEQLQPPVETKLKAKLRKAKLNLGFPSREVAEAYLNPEVDKSTENFSFGKPDLDLLRQYAKQKFGWNKAKSDEMLLPVIKQVNANQTQQHITQFFLPTQLETETRKVKSKRVKRILNRMRNPDMPQETAVGRTPARRGGGRGRGKHRAEAVACLSESSSEDSDDNITATALPDAVVLSESSSNSDSENADKANSKRKSDRVVGSPRAKPSKRARKR